MGHTENGCCLLHDVDICKKYDPLKKYAAPGMDSSFSTLWLFIGDHFFILFHLNCVVFYDIESIE